MPINLPDEEFEPLVVKAIDSLPDEFLRLMESGNLSISYADEPTEDQRAGLKNKDGEIFGMHTGSSKQSSLSPIGSWPSFVYIFKLAVQKRCDTIEQVQDFVRGILMHEIGHFFGLSEAKLAEIGQLSSVGERPSPILRSGMTTAYDSSKRRKAFGVYTGCPCSIDLPHGVSTEDRDLSEEKFNKMVEDLMAQWRGQCGKYVPGPRVAPRIQENWNRGIKLPYGKYAYVSCALDEGSGGERYCKYSLKEEGS